MCGIVGAIAERNVWPILLEGLKRLEYRGYDSAGMAVSHNNTIERVRVLGKVDKLNTALQTQPLQGHLGIAHTRWATHGEPKENNAHPHFSAPQVAVVHNGIIENYERLRDDLLALGYTFDSDTDTEVICHLLDYHYKHCGDHHESIRQTLHALQGAYALGILFVDAPDTLFAARHGSPLVIGVGLGEHFIASDQLALLPVTQRFLLLEDGEIATLTRTTVDIENAEAKRINRDIHIATVSLDTTSKGQYRHYMQKEIAEQPQALAATLQGHLHSHNVPYHTFGHRAAAVLPTIKRVQIVACGTSYHAGLVAKTWLETIAGIPCQVDIASEFRYRAVIVEPDTLCVALSQSGETADTLGAVKKAKHAGYSATLAICNVAHSSLMRETDLNFLMQAGAEIGVAATKTFTAQLTALLLLTLCLNAGREHDAAIRQEVIDDLKQLPTYIEALLALDGAIETLAEAFKDKTHALFLGRGKFFPIALEGALKLKEISYIHAEAYPAGELKHGPLALVDDQMPVIVLAPNNQLIDKLSSNIKEVEARGGHVFVITDETLHWTPTNTRHIVKLPQIPDMIAPIAYTIPLQLLAYHVAVLKGTDVDQPRNLAKSVTVE